MTPRPPKAAADKRSHPLQLRLTKAERDCLREGARAAGQTLSDFVRRAGVEKARRLTGRAPEA